MFYDNFFPEIDSTIVNDFAILIQKGLRSFNNIPICLHPFIKKACLK